MLIKILGGIDLIAGAILIFGGANLPIQILAGFGIVLLAKSCLGFLKDFASWVDLSAGIIFLLSIIILIPGIISLIFGLLIIQKGIFSFI